MYLYVYDNNHNLIDTIVSRLHLDRKDGAYDIDTSIHRDDCIEQYQEQYLQNIYYYKFY